MRARDNDSDMRWRFQRQSKSSKKNRPAKGGKVSGYRDGFHDIYYIFCWGVDYSASPCAERKGKAAVQVSTSGSSGISGEALGKPREPEDGFTSLTIDCDFLGGGIKKSVFAYKHTLGDIKCPFDPLKVEDFIVGFRLVCITSLYVRYDTHWCPAKVLGVW